jgi:ligand-binding sensor domain-containing protein
MFFLCLFFCFIQKNTILAQLSFPETYGYRVHDRETNFPLQNIQDIKQDSDNFIWCTSFNYLVKLNGEGFTHFSNKILPEFKNSNFYQIAEDKDKNLWFGTYHGLMKRNKFNQWEVIPIGQNIGAINAVFLTKKQEIYCASDEKLFLVKGEKITEYVIDYTFKKRITNVVVGNDDDFYIGTEGDGLLHVKNGKVVKIYDQESGLKNGNIIYIGKLKKDEIWVGTTTGVYLLKNGEIIDLCEKYNLPSVLYNCVFELANSQILFGTKKGLWVVDTEEKTPPKILLEGKEVRIIFEDKEKNIWVGTYRDGLHQFFPAKFKNFGEKNVLPKNLK